MPARLYFVASGLLIIGCIVSACSAGPSVPTSAQLPVNLEEPAPTAASSETASPPLSPTSPADDVPPSGAASSFTTDFSKHTVAYTEIFSGGPPKDGIPAIDHPRFVSVSNASEWLKPAEPVILVRVGEEARAYPIQILTWHEIVNDTLGGIPLTVTFCPLCNTAIAFERTFESRVLDFGTTGRLRFSNLIMYDRQSETWWQQATGGAIAGELSGARLAYYPASIIGWSEFAEAYPEGSVLSRDTGFERPYGRNPYTGYDDVNSSPFLYNGPETRGILPPMARVLTIDLNGEAVAYSYETLQDVHVVNDTVGGTPVVVIWQPGAASPFGSIPATGVGTVGSAEAYGREVDGQLLNFEFDGSQIRDQETGTTWNIFGLAEQGELAGKQLPSLVTINHFWFSWAAFRPDTRVYGNP
ncbi:MAG TPA: DUF3179 domain-containing protein [Anaerolineales bacterium]|nr:DUF3179 domain-containing protein [Anaerolineales bacterium]